MRKTSASTLGKGIGNPLSKTSAGQLAAASQAFPAVYRSRTHRADLLTRIEKILRPTHLIDNSQYLAKGHHFTMNGSEGRKPVKRKAAIDAENELAALAEKGDEKSCIEI